MLNALRNEFGLLASPHSVPPPSPAASPMVTSGQSDQHLLQHLLQPEPQRQVQVTSTTGDDQLPEGQDHAQVLKALRDEFGLLATESPAPLPSPPIKHQFQVSAQPQDEDQLQLDRSLPTFKPATLSSDHALTAHRFRVGQRVRYPPFCGVTIEALTPPCDETGGHPGYSLRVNGLPLQVNVGEHLLQDTR